MSNKNPDREANKPTDGNIKPTFSYSRGREMSRKPKSSDSLYAPYYKTSLANGQEVKICSVSLKISGMSRCRTQTKKKCVIPLLTPPISSENVFIHNRSVM